MIHISWKDRYNINYKDIDEQHKRLLAILNELVDLQAKPDPERVSDVFHRLCDYALTHFANEERYMAAAGYPRLVAHQAEHGTFIHRLLTLNKSFDPEDPRLAEITFEFVKDWYLTHIMKSDMEYSATLREFRSQAAIRAVIFDMEDLVCEVRREGLLEAEAQLGGREIPDAEWRSLYPDLLTPREETLELARKVKRRYRAGLLGNAAPLLLKALEASGVPPLFDAVLLIPGGEAERKSPQSFREIADKLGFMEEECVFATTQARMAIAASSALLHGIAGADAASLEAKFSHLGMDLSPLPEAPEVPAEPKEEYEKNA